MQIQLRLTSKQTLYALLGLILTGWVGSIPAAAQNNTMTDQTMREESWGIDPMGIGYPYAAPGGLDMYHWSDYTRTHLVPGSAANQRWEHRRMEREEAMKNGEVRFKPWMIEPMPISYPYAPPASIDLYTWSDYTRTQLVPGSVANRRWEHRRMEREEAMKNGEVRFESWMIEPMPISYPYAAPGGLDLYHWSDYTRTQFLPGSAADKRWQNRRMEMEYNHQQQNNTDASTPNTNNQ